MMFKHLQLIEAKTSQKLVDILRSITVPFNIIQIYSDGAKHYAVIQSTFKIKVIK